MFLTYGMILLKCINMASHDSQIQKYEHIFVHTLGTNIISTYSKDFISVECIVCDFKRLL